MKTRFSITRLEERIAPTIVPGEGITHDPCPPGLEAKIGDPDTPVIVVGSCECCTMWNANAAAPSRVFID